MVGTAVPYRWITGLPEVAQREIERNFLALQQQFTAATAGTYDAIVDPGLASNDLTTNQYTTVFAALAQLSANGLTSCSIGVRPRTTTITETGSCTASPNTVRLEVIGGNGMAQGGAIGTPVWNLGGFNDGGFVGNWIINGLEVQSTLNASQRFFTAAAVNIMASNCFFNGNNTRMGVNGASTLYFTNCLIEDMTMAAVTTYIDNTCVFYNAVTGPQWSGDVYACDCELVFGQTGITLQFTTTTYIIWTGHHTLNSQWAGLLGTTQEFGTVSIGAFGAMSCVHWENRAPSVTGNNNQRISLNISATCAYLTVIGTYQDLTTTGMASTAPIFQRIEAQCRSADITGPANLMLTCGKLGPDVNSFCKLRGNGFSGSVTCLNADGAAGIVFQGIGMKRAVLHVSLNQQSGSVGSNMQQYTIDSASANNVIVMEADAFGVAGVNSSASTRIITDQNDGMEVAYGQFTAGPLTVTSAAEATPTIVATATAFTFDGVTPFWFEVYAAEVDVSGAGNWCAFELYEGAGPTDYCTLALTADPIGVVYAKVKLTPAAGSKTFKLGAYKNAAGTTATVQAQAGGSAQYAPAFIRVTRA